MTSKESLLKFPFIPADKIAYCVVLCHRHADVDAICSAFAIASLIRKLSKKAHVEIGTPQGMGALARRVQQWLNIKVSNEPNLGRAELVVIADTGHIALLSELADRLEGCNAPKVLVDHHPLDESTKRVADFVLVDKKAVATCEIVYRMYEAKGITIPGRVAKALLAGILVDSLHLALADRKSIEVVLELCKAGAPLNGVKKVLAAAREPAQSLARLKGAQRLEIYGTDRWIICLTTVSSFNASTAEAIVTMGADVAVALGEAERGVRGSFRASQLFYEESKVHLGTDVASAVAKKLMGGVGGGHPRASSFTAQDSLDRAKRVILEVLEEGLAGKLTEV